MILCFSTLVTSAFVGFAYYQDIIVGRSAYSGILLVVIPVFQSVCLAFSCAIAVTIDSWVSAK
jgi:hypothetical protein